MDVHESVTYELVERLAHERLTSLENPGICLACGNQQEGCEPDARQYTCEQCGAPQVYGAEEILVMGVAHD